MKTKGLEYVEKYYHNYADGMVDGEIETTGNFLIENVKGKVLDCGCGPVPQLWAICMPYMQELHAIDLPKESIDFVKNKIADANNWYKSFSNYQKFVEEKVGTLLSDYILKQVAKIKSIEQADMTKKIPFPTDYFDTVTSLYSLGCLNNEQELEQALINIHSVLKSGGVFLHINTNGHNTNDELPAYTWNGLAQTSALIEDYLAKFGFVEISKKEVELDSSDTGMYKYNKISLIRAVRL